MASISTAPSHAADRHSPHPLHAVTHLRSLSPPPDTQNGTSPAAMSHPVGQPPPPAQLSFSTTAARGSPQRQQQQQQQQQRHNHHHHHHHKHHHHNRARNNSHPPSPSSLSSYSSSTSPLKPSSSAAAAPPLLALGAARLNSTITANLEDSGSAVAAAAAAAAASSTLAPSPTSPPAPAFSFSAATHAAATESSFAAPVAHRPRTRSLPDGGAAALIAASLCEDGGGVRAAVGEEQTQDEVGEEEEEEAAAAAAAAKKWRAAAATGSRLLDQRFRQWLCSEPAARAAVLARGLLAVEGAGGRVGGGGGVGWVADEVLRRAEAVERAARGAPAVTQQRLADWTPAPLPSPQSQSLQSQQSQQSGQSQPSSAAAEQHGSRDADPALAGAVGSDAASLYDDDGGGFGVGESGGTAAVEPRKVADDADADVGRDSGVAFPPDANLSSPGAGHDSPPLLLLQQAAPLPSKVLAAGTVDDGDGGDDLDVGGGSSAGGVDRGGAGGSGGSKSSGLKVDSGVDLLPAQAIPRFYFPRGDPNANLTGQIRSAKSTLDEIKALFGVCDDSPRGVPLGKANLWPVMDCCRLPRFCSFAVFAKCRAAAAATADAVSFDEFERWWDSMKELFLDEHAMVFRIMQSGGGGGATMSKYITPRDFEPLIEEVVQRHPGLEFLANLPVFQARYVDTVIVRIFFNKLGGTQDRMTLAEFRKHPFLDIFRRLQFEDDINVSRDLFSYKHFYVLYCKFWELDGNHDMIIEGNDLYKYNRHALTGVAIDRVLSGACRTLAHGADSRRLDYRDFVWFMLSAEDKRSPSGTAYWFRCLDLDGDGVVSLYEIERFYDEQFRRMVAYRISEPWKFGDFVCSLFDLVKPKSPAHITLSDLKKCSNSAIFFDLIFDYRKYENYVRRIEPSFREADDVWIEENGKKVKLEGWNKYAERAYDQLAQDDGSNQHGYDGGGIGEEDHLLDDEDGMMLADDGFDMEELDADWGVGPDSEEAVAAEEMMGGDGEGDAGGGGGGGSHIPVGPLGDEYDEEEYDDDDDDNDDDDDREEEEEGDRDGKEELDQGEAEVLEAGTKHSRSNGMMEAIEPRRAANDEDLLGGKGRAGRGGRRQLRVKGIAAGLQWTLAPIETTGDEEGGTLPFASSSSAEDAANRRVAGRSGTEWGDVEEGDDDDDDDDGKSMENAHVAGGEAQQQRQDLDAAVLSVQSPLKEDVGGGYVRHADGRVSKVLAQRRRQDARAGGEVESDKASDRDAFGDVDGGDADADEGDDKVTSAAVALGRLDLGGGGGGSGGGNGNLQQQAAVDPVEVDGAASTAATGPVEATTPTRGGGGGGGSGGGRWRLDLGRISQRFK